MVCVICIDSPVVICKPSNYQLQTFCWKHLFSLGVTLTSVMKRPLESFHYGYRITYNPVWYFLRFYFHLSTNSLEVAYGTQRPGRELDYVAKKKCWHRQPSPVNLQTPLHTQANAYTRPNSRPCNLAESHASVPTRCAVIHKSQCPFCRLVTFTQRIVHRN